MQADGELEKKKGGNALQNVVAWQNKTKNNSALISWCYHREERVRLSVINQCLEAGADPNAVDGAGNSALMIALDNQNDHVAEFLVKKGANPLYKSRNQLTAFDFVSTSSPLFSLMQEKAKEHSLRQETAEVRVTRLSKELHEEVNGMAPKVRKIKSFLEQGAKINYQDPEDGYTVLMLAVDAQNDRIAEYLLNQGADPLLRNKAGETARNLASVNSPIYFLLKEKEAAITASKLPSNYANSFLFHEYLSGPEVRAQKIEEYMKAGVDINFQNSKGFTGLMIMVEKGNESIAEFLLKAGADPLVKNKGDKIASDYASQNSGIYNLLKGYELLCATSKGDIVMVQQLLNRNGMLIDFMGQRGYSGLLIAVEQGFFEVAECYLSRGADLCATCDDGSGVFNLAKDQKMIDLLERYQNLNQPAEFIEDNEEHPVQVTEDSQTVNSFGI